MAIGKRRLPSQIASNLSAGNPECLATFQTWLEAQIEHDDHEEIVAKVIEIVWERHMKKDGLARKQEKTTTKNTKNKSATAIRNWEAYLHGIIKNVVRDLRKHERDCVSLDCSCRADNDFGLVDPRSRVPSEPLDTTLLFDSVWRGLSAEEKRILRWEGSAEDKDRRPLSHRERKMRSRLKKRLREEFERLDRKEDQQ